MLTPEFVAYFLLNQELTHLSLTAHTFCICFFPATCIVYMQYQNKKTELSIQYCLFTLR